MMFVKIKYSKKNKLLLFKRVLKIVLKELISIEMPGLSLKSVIT